MTRRAATELPITPAATGVVVATCAGPTAREKEPLRELAGQVDETLVKEASMVTVRRVVLSRREARVTVPVGQQHAGAQPELVKMPS